jgi:ribosome-associated protein
MKLTKLTKKKPTAKSSRAGATSRPRPGTTTAKKGGKKSLGAKRPKKVVAHAELSPDEIPENPKAKALAQRIGALMLDKKGTEVIILDLRGKASYADYVVLASGESERQVSAMAEHVENTLRPEGIRPVGSEGYESGGWVLLDYGEVVAHLFFNEVRAYYDLEGLWADATRERVA